MGMSLPEGTAQDGRTFSQESVATQALFRLVWADRAAQEWVNQHNAALPSQWRANVRRAILTRAPLGLAMAGQSERRRGYRTLCHETCVEPAHWAPC